MKRYHLLLLILLLLSSCSTGRVEISPQTYPSYPPGSRTIMVASWYGKKFHGRPTASGERFNMYDHTAAHKTLPFGTLLKVINPKTGKSVIVRINDRGPFVSGRDIDLSYGAARAIGMVQQGTGRVYVEFLGRDRGYIRTVKYTATSGPFTLQVASFTEPDNAYRLKRILQYSYNGVYIMRVWVGGRTYYRVRIGRFSTREEADSLAKRLSREGYEVIVTRYEEVS